MDRVKGAAGELRNHGVNAKWYQAWKMNPFDAELSLTRNTRWIETKKAQGYHIVDIGPDVSRADPYGPFYGMEVKNTAGYDPRHQMDWP
jgi:hypothetical protein